MTINLQKPDLTEQKPRITVFGVGGGGGNAVNNMITAGLEGVDFVVANTDAQALAASRASRVVQLGVSATQGLGAGSQPEVGEAAAEECIDEILDHLNGVHMCFVTAGMGGGTGTGAAPVVARAARERGILTVGVVTKPFHFEGQRRMRTAEKGIEALQEHVDTLIVIPNQNLFRIANDKTTFADAFAMADQVLYSGVACITDLMVKEGLINLDFADVRAVMREMGKAMMGTGEASGDGRALAAAEAAISNPLLDETSMAGAQGLLISITGGRDMTLFEVDEAATRIREEVDPDANIILGATFDEALEGVIRVSVVATGIEGSAKRSLKSDAPTMATRAVGAPLAQKPAAPAAAPAQAVARTAAPQTATAPVEQAARPAAVQAPVTAPEAVVDANTESRIEDWEDSIAAQRGVPEFRPRSTLFANAPTAAPVAAQRPAQPVQQAAQPQPRPAQPVAQPVAEAPRPAPQQVAPVRMPKIDDFPAPVRAEFSERTAAPVPRAEDDRSPVSLLKRLTHGLTRREDDHQAAPREPQLRAPEAARPAPQDASIYAPKRAASQSQPQVAANQTEDDMLEIPAFLRRHAN